MENFNLIDISNKETELIKNAKDEYGKFYSNAEDLVFLLFNFLKSADADIWIFMSFLSQVQKYSILSLLSIIRRHSSQSQYNIRQIFEASVFAVYSLHEKNHNSYYYEDEKGLAHEKKDTKEKANRWLENNYKTHSDIFINQKKLINSMWTHSNILLTTLNFKFKENKFFNSVFDKDDKFQTNSRLWFLADSCWGILDLFSKEITRNKTAILIDDFGIKMKQYGNETELLKKSSWQIQELKIK